MVAARKLRGSQGYRPDIDGLRAVAIIPVVLFHAYPHKFPGGFIGVDVFFVISGYLISRIIFTDLAADRFSFGKFYASRINRIAPALLVVLIATYAFGWISMLSDEFARLGRHLSAGALFFENFTLWNEVGYFDPSSETKPLMHLWSLAIEMQFYLIFPPMIWLAWRCGISLLGIVLVAGAVSFIASVWLSFTAPTSAFFLPQARAWELMAGGVVAYFSVFESPATAWLARHTARFRLKPLWQGAIVVLAILAFVSFVLKWDSAWVFPGYWALVPVAFAVFFIAIGSRRPEASILASRPMVAIGLISYPLYLWHWPLLSYLNILKGGLESSALRNCVVIAAVILAVLTYWLVEQPIRLSRRRLAKSAALAGVLVVLAGVGDYTIRAAGFPMRPVRAHEVVLARGNETLAGPKPVPGCGLDEPEASLFVRCLRDAGGPPTVALIGDSKADALAPAIFADTARQGRWMFIGGARQEGVTMPLLSSLPAYAPYQKLATLAIDRLSAMPDIKVVVITVATRAIFLLDNFNSIGDLPETKHYAAALDALSRSVGALVAAGKKVVITVDNPTLKDPKYCMARPTSLDWLNRLFRLENNEACNIAYSRQRELSKKYLDLLAAVQREFPNDVSVVDFTDMLCDISRDRCDVSENGKLLYSYTDHISNYAAAKITRRLLPQVDALLN